MSSPKVIFLGNCQAQAFESLSAYLGLKIEVIGVPPIWLLNGNDRDNLLRKFEEADFIFSQRLSDTYPFELLRNAALREAYGSKVVVWPNIYFDGYFPGIRYLYNQSGKVTGPLSDYHFQWIMDGWRMERSIEETVGVVCDFSKWSGEPDFVERSLNELRDREKVVDVTISDYVRDNFRTKKLFYTMNHPKTVVLAEMLKRIVTSVGLECKPEHLEGYAYHLQQINLPAFPIFQQRYMAVFKEEDVFKGVTADQENEGLETKPAFYDYVSLVERFYRIYDASFSRNSPFT